MRDVLTPYYHRAPRYILMPQDDCFIRVAGPKQTPWEEGTEIRNISNTGLCFTAPEVLLPQMGEYIRIQFQVPSAKEMACHGRVVRIEKLDVDSFLVGVEFEALNSSQKWNLTRGLKKKNTHENQSVIELGENMRNLPPWVMALFYASVGFSLFFSAFLMAAVFKLLSDPLGLDRIVWLFQALWHSL